MLFECDHCLSNCSAPRELHHSRRAPALWKDSIGSRCYKEACLEVGRCREVIITRYILMQQLQSA